MTIGRGGELMDLSGYISRQNPVKIKRLWTSSLPLKKTCLIFFFFIFFPNSLNITGVFGGVTLDIYIF